MRLFLDTNVLLYTQDASEPVKQEQARALLGRHAADDLVVSTQVLMEFYRNLLRKDLCSPRDAALLCRAWTEHEVVSVTPSLVLGAIDLHQKRQFSIWDALILAAATEAGCAIVYTEDLQDGARVGPLEIVNPFLAHGVHEPTARHRATAGASRSADKASAPSSPAGTASSRRRRTPSPR